MHGSPIEEVDFSHRLLVRYAAKSLILQVFFKYPKILGDFDIISLIICLFLSEDIFGIIPALFLLLLYTIQTIFFVLFYPIVYIHVINIKVLGYSSVW